MIYYISGKISGLTKETYTRNFNNAKRQILNTIVIDNNFKIVNPLEIKHPFKFWLGYLIVDLCYLRKCTHIALMPNWTDSRGAVVEYYFSKFIFKHKIIWL